MAIVQRQNVFVVVAKLPNESLAVQLEQRYGPDQVPIGIGAWLVATSETEREFSDHMGITSGAYGPCLVTGISNFYGVMPQDVWGWLSLRLGLRIHA